LNNQIIRLYLLFCDKPTLLNQIWRFRRTAQNTPKFALLHFSGGWASEAISFGAITHPEKIKDTVTPRRYPLILLKQLHYDNGINWGKLSHYLFIRVVPE
jgi:hypothetical protein